MLHYIALYFGMSYVFTLVMGYQQMRNVSVLHGVLGGDTESGIWSILGVSAMCVQAFVSVAVLHGNEWFPVAALFVAFTLMCHHSIIHWQSRFEGETCSCAPFQCKDISNHETWVVASLVAGLVSLLHI
jgi:hypothetical protein